MYCKNCGCKINTDERRCPDCGTDASETEYCGGFWGLVGEEESVKKTHHIEERSNVVFTKKTVEKKQKSEKEYERLNDELNYAIKKHAGVTKKYKNLKAYFVCVVLILLSICFIQLIWIYNVSKKYETLYTRYDELNSKLDSHYDEIINRFEKVSIFMMEEDILEEYEIENINGEEGVDETEKLSNELDEISEGTKVSLEEVEKQTYESGKAEESYDSRVNMSVSDNSDNRWNQFKREVIDNE